MGVYEHRGPSKFNEEKGTLRVWGWEFWFIDGPLPALLAIHLAPKP